MPYTCREVVLVPYARAERAHELHAVAEFTEREHRMALEWAAGRCAHVTTTDRVF